jgi:transposase InsO family protein
MPRVKQELDSLEDQGIISQVPEPTLWVHPIVIVPKDDGGIRICGDFTSLNHCIIRPTFDSPTPFQAVRTIPTGMKFFTVIDALKGYHQVELDEESSAMTTFSTPFGRFKYNRLPFGVSLAGDDYGRRLANIFDDLPNCRRVVEDILVFSPTWEEHVDLVRRLFRLAADHQIAINVRKVVFAQPSVLFGGYVVGESGFRPSPDLLRAIREFPAPTCVSEMRAFHGLCQQVGNFSDDLAPVLRPLAPLLRKEFVWEWTMQHEKDFKAARESLSSSSELSFYDSAAPTSLHVDASRLRGLGFILRQQKADGSWNVVQAGSRFLSDAESRYAMIELECLAAAWAMRKCRQFLEGLPSFQLVTDHRPLIPILNDYHLDKLDNPRILRLRLSMQRYSFVAVWVPGKNNVMADALSRSPVDRPSESDEIAEGPQSFSARISLLDTMEGSDDANPDILLTSVAAATSADPIMLSLRQMILDGFPNEKCNLPLELRPFWQVRSQLSVDDAEGLILVGPRVVIPTSLRQEIIRRLLQMHQGATKLRQRARLSIYWPSMDNDIVVAAKSCPSCTERLPSHPAEPLLPHAPASRPFEFVFVDLGAYRGRDFLIVADQFSGWPQVFPFPDTNTSTRRVIDALRSFFTCGAGAPVKLWSDGGPQFKSDEFLAFLRDWDISNGRSSPHHPQSNGYAESAVKSMKKLIAGSWSSGSFDPDTFGKALLLFRNAPMSGGASPSQIVFSRPTRDLLPAHRRSFAPEWQQAAELLEKRAQRAKELQIQHFNRTAHPLPPLVIGDSVLIQDHKSKRWSTPRVIVEVGPFRDYLVKTPAGRLFRRNRRFLRVISPQIPRPQPPASTSTTTSPVQLPGPAPPTAPSSTLRRSRRLAAKIAS